MEKIAYLGLGANLGEPRHQMALAISLLDAHAKINVEAVSKLYVTPPWGKPDQPDYLNAALRIKTTLAAQSLLGVCLDIEHRLHRVRNERWGPRLIDIDILAIEGEHVEEEQLQIPHPRLHERLFALLPLADVSNDLCLHDQALTHWIAQLDAEGIKREGDADWWRV